ncbi:unknown [Bacteroides sp. CAG:702]|nr:unknown [Bacteroides sp. CAG:702]
MSRQDISCLLFKNISTDILSCYFDLLPDCQVYSFYGTEVIGTFGADF